MHSNQPPATLGYILKGYPRISETFISNEIFLLEQLGFTLRLFPMRKPRESFTHASVKDIKAKVDYLPSELLVDIYRLLVPNIFLAVSQPRRYLTTLRKASEGLNPASGLATFKHVLQAGYLTHRHLRHDNIAHLHGHFAHSPTSVTMFASLLSGIPFSFTAHAKDIYTTDAGKLARKIDAARFVVTCTRHNLEYLRKIAGHSSTPIHCIYHGIDLNLFATTAPRTKATKPFKLLTVARMTPKKGLPTIYRALARLRDGGLAFEHTLIGDGDDRQDTLALISTLGLNDHCHWLGTQTHEEVLKHFNNSDLFVLGCEIAANGDRDGIPNVLVESLAMGIPAISSAVSAIPEILIDGETGLTVPPSQPELLAEAIERALTDGDLRERLVTAGRRYVLDNFNNRQWINQLARIFHGQDNLLQPFLADRLNDPSDHGH